jgi:hypothetical protein
MRRTIQEKREDFAGGRVEDIPIDLQEKIEYHLKIPPKVF